MPEIMCGRVIATFIGLLGVIFSIAPFIYLLFYTAHFSAKTFYIIVVVLNFVACIRWLWGIIEKKTLFMVVPLVWWTFLLILWTIAAVYYLIRSVFNGYSDVHDKWIPVVALFLLVFYIAAIMSFISMKNAVYRVSSKSQSNDVTYTKAKENSGLLVQTV